MENRYNDQAKFTERVFRHLEGGMPESLEDKVKWTKEYLLCINAECIEVLNELNWKHHRKESKEIVISNLGIEMIDIQKYLWGLFRIWNVPYEEFLKLYDDKTIEVVFKWVQEQELPDLTTKEKICIIDIDGVISDYPKCFYEWVESEYGVDIEDTCNMVAYEKYKDLYRSSGYKRNLPVIIDTISSMNKLKDLGYTIVLLTNRPINKYHRMCADTLYWLEKVKAKYDYIYWADGRKILAIHDKCKKIDFIVDDNPDILEDFAKLGIKSYCMSNKDNIKDIINISKLSEIEELNS